MKQIKYPTIVLDESQNKQNKLIKFQFNSILFNFISLIERILYFQVVFRLRYKFDVFLFLVYIL